MSANNQKIKFASELTIAAGLHALAQQFPDEKIIWCDSNVKDHLNIEGIENLMHHNKMMLSYTPDERNYLNTKIGYVEESPFIRINKQVSYPTWQMSSLVGGVHASILIAISDKIKLDSNFDYYLNSVAKVCMPLGLLCYSEPKLLRRFDPVDYPQASIYSLFKFVKQHYKARWVLLLFLNLMIYEKKFPFLAAFYAGFFKNRNSTGINLDDITVSSSLAIVDEQIIDVIIPTIGRKKYLYDFLCDLRKQTYLPTNVIIVEQNPLLDSMSELDYLYNELWPFRIKHTFIHQSGACNARNVALSQVESKWVFFADDDIRIDENFIVNVFRKINNWCVKAVSINCSHEGEIEQFTKAFQWTSFGSGCSFVLNKSIKNCKFSKGFEFGYGEDSDFGMQVRNQGSDILYLPEPKIFHLRAPIGGFRTKPNLLWVNEKIQPKPSPTVMLYKILNNTEQERRGYKTILFFKYYKHQERKNPVGYFFHFNKQWNQSKFWADQLKNTI